MMQKAAGFWVHVNWTSGQDNSTSCHAIRLNWQSEISNDMNALNTQMTNTAYMHVQT